MQRSSLGFAASLAALLSLAFSPPLCLAQGYSSDRSDQDAGADAVETIDMRPEERPPFGFRNLSVGVAALFRGFDHYYDHHVVWVETTPAGAFLDLFYVRSNFQKRFEQAESPVRVLLPPRVETGDQDLLTIRAFADGYRQQTVTVKAGTIEDSVIIHLDPLPNTLQSLSHQYFAGRTSLTFLTVEQLAFRLQEADDGLSVILAETAQSPLAAASLESARSPIVQGMAGQQLGEDLLVQVTYSDHAIESRVEMRSRESFDAARKLHRFTIDLVVEGESAGAVARARAALLNLAEGDVTGCSREFDTALRKQLDAGALARALTPSGSLTDPYLRAAMRRLGELSPNGVVSFAGGGEFDPSVPIELEAALSRAADAVGYLSLLRRFVAEFEPGEYMRETLRSLIAPELDLERFGKLIEAAEMSQHACQASL